MSIWGDQMSDNGEQYNQRNAGERVIANQGGPQNIGDARTQYQSAGGPQTFGDGPQHFGQGPLNNNSGNGQQNVNNGRGSMTVNNLVQQMRDLFAGGELALKQGEYAKVVERFRDYLSTAEQAGNTASGTGARVADREVANGEKLARAHVYLALGLLNGSRPSYHSSEVILEVERHLAQAREQGLGTPAVPLAEVPLAIVKEDFYYERGIQTSPPARDPKTSLAEVEPDDLKILAKHLSRAEGGTWREMATVAASRGYTAPVVAEEEGQRVIAPDRRTKVTKYFTKTPDKVDPLWHSLLFGGAGLLVLVGIISQNVILAILLVAAAAWVGKKGYNQYKRYQTFRKKWDAAEPKPHHSELDRWLDEDTADITRRGARRLQVRLDKELSQSDLITPPILVVGVPNASDTRNGKLAVRVDPDDHDVRADHYNVLVLFLTRQVVSAYRCILEFTTGELLQEETYQYHWGNIVGVSSISIPASRSLEEFANLVLIGEGQKKQNISSVHQFTISIVNGEKLPVTTRFGGQSFEGSDGKVHWKGNDHALSIIQSEVRARNTR